MRRWLAVWALIWLALLAPAALAQREPAKIALLIGNQNYDRSVGELKNPHNDITVVSEALTTQGFRVLPLVKEARRSAILGAVRELVRQLNAAGNGAIGFLYYSGHGAAESDTGFNYLIPIDAKEPGSATFWDDSLKLDEILKLLDGAKAAAKFIVFDACRNELRVPSKSTTKGLMPVTEQQGMFIAYASAPGRTASDAGNTSGPYAAALAGELTKSGVDHLNLFQNVKESVLASTGGSQQPWESNGLGRRVYLTGLPQAAPAVPAQQPASAASGGGLSEAAIAWDRIRQSQSVGVVEAFAKQFPGTVYAAEAQERLGELRRAADERQRVGLLQKPEEDRRRTEPATADPWAEFRPQEDRRRAAAAAEEEKRKVSDGATTRDPAFGVAPGSGMSFRDCPDCPELVVVPAGSFMMGSSSAEIAALTKEYPDGKDWWNTEALQRRVTLGQSFAVGKFEVTFAEWDACVADGGCNRRPGDGNWGRNTRPVINVSWDHITKEYLRWISKKTGKHYRLLSEAEWEYAARAGTITPYSFGRAISTDEANYDGTFIYGSGRKGVYRQKTIEVGSLKKPNAWGLHDMHGNVWEWVRDCYDENYNAAPNDGTEAPEWPGCSRVLRGGSWINFPQFLRAAIRSSSQSGNHSDLFGFRVARTLAP